MDARMRSLLFGFGGGAAPTALAPIVAPIFAEALRPMAKALLRGGWLMADSLHTLAARVSEATEDLLAEVRSEVQSELDRRAEAASSASGPQVKAFHPGKHESPGAPPDRKHRHKSEP